MFNFCWLFITCLPVSVIWYLSSKTPIIIYSLSIMEDIYIFPIQYIF